MGRLFGYAALSAVLSLLSACSHDAGLGSDRRGTAGTGGTNGGAGGTGTTGGNGFAASGNFMNTGFDSGLANSDGAASDSSSTVVLTFPDGAVSGGVKLVCTPGSLLVSGAAATIKCSVLLENGSAAPNVVWIVDDTRIGSIGQDGVFSANGFVGGVVKVTANIGTATISTSLTIDVVIQNNIDGITPADITKLAAGGSADGSFGWLYPYDKTVFPRGLQPPELQFSGGCADSTYLKITYPHYVYEQAAAGTSPLRVTIPDAVWRGLTLTSTGSDLVKVSVSKLCAGQVTGPINESWLIAPGKMKGAVYYTTYGSKVFIDPATKLPLAGAFRIRLGSYTEPYIAGCTTCNTGCTVCHSVSANGGVLGSGWNWGGGRGEPDLSKTFDLTSSAIPPPELGSTDNGLIFAWPGLTPDGKRALTNGVPQMGTQLKKIGAGAGIPAVLVDTTTVQVIPSSLPVKFMQTPAFSPDSLHVAFNNSDLGPGHLSVMDYDGTQNPPVFSNLTDVVQSVSLVGWPSYLPDSQAVVYHEGKNFETINAELRLVELGTKTVSSLAALNGYLPDGSLYLPWGAAQDQNVHYQPTVLPRPIGGYYWVMFSSRRGYGNTIAPGGTVVGGGTPGTITSPRLKIWVAAIDIDHPGKTDPSHPAFLLSGQELESGNVRPFVSLEPCRPQGASCESGADCCDGFCRETGRASDGTPILQCVPPPAPGTSCSNVDEFCTTPADCCDTTLLCILNRCAIPPPPPIF